MPRITILPEHIANKIAAGEVVERPASVVKELVENSIDAGATRISVSIIKAGKTEIRVTDNGIGMSKDDALLAFERHATSKIKSSEDLDNISTLGFRGEALPSIASVSRLKMITRTKDSEAGTQITINAGVVKDVREVGAPTGTTIIVRNLFYNTPARRKFLRTDQTEMGHITEQVLRLALAHPEIYFNLIHQGRTIHDFPPTGDSFSRASQVFGTRLLNAGQSFTHENGSIQIAGFVAPPEMNRSSAHNIYTFVNSRFIKDSLLNRTIIKAYQGLLPKDRFPMAMIMITLPPQDVDVNVHPTKSEVRFRNVSKVLITLQEGITKALGELQKRGWDRPLVVQESESKPVQTWRETPSRFHTVPVTPYIETVAPKTSTPDMSSTDHSENMGIPAEEKTRGTFASLQIIGQLGDSYILCEAPDGLVIIDQHAAHERIIFDALSKKKDDESIASQLLLTPQPLELLPGEASVLSGIRHHLSAMGFEVEPFGGNTFVVKSIPAYLEGEDPAKIISDLISEALSEEWTKGEKRDIGIRLRQSMACKAAVKANSKLNKEEIAALLKQLDKTDNPATCPHGRPLWWKITNEEIARFFKRGHSPV